MSATYFNLLRRMPVFGGLNDKTLQLILDQSTVINVAAGDFFFRQGEPAESFFVLQEGVVAIERSWQDTQLSLGRLKAGDCIGEMSLIDLMPRSASVRAEQACIAIEITLRSLHNLYKQEPEQYAIIMMNMGREVSRRLRIADDRLLALEHKYRSQASGIVE